MVTSATLWTPVEEHRIDGSLDLAATFSPLRQGVADPTLRVSAITVLRALRTAEGAATVEFRLDGDRLRVRAAGPGAREALGLAPRLAGLHDDPSALIPLHQAVRDAQRHAIGLRLTAGTRPFDAVVWCVITQKVVGLDARRAYRDLVHLLGEPAPGVPGMLLPPAAATLARTPYWAFHQCNVERRRARVIVDLAQRAVRINQLGVLPPAEASSRLQSIAGVGPWTAAEVVAVSHGDPDSVAVGDYHLPNVVAWALAGEPRGDDARMLELLRPYAGQRGRVTRLLVHGGQRAPRRGPPMPRRNIRDL